MLKRTKAIVSNPSWNVNLYRMGQVFKFQHMIYEKYIIWTEEDKIWNKQHFVENKQEIMQHVLKMQYISMLSKYINEFQGWSCYICSHMQVQVFQKLTHWAGQEIPFTNLYHVDVYACCLRKELRTPEGSVWHPELESRIVPMPLVYDVLLYSCCSKNLIHN